LQNTAQHTLQQEKMGSFYLKSYFISTLLDATFVCEM